MASISSDLWKLLPIADGPDVAADRKNVQNEDDRRSSMQPNQAKRGRRVYHVIGAAKIRIWGFRVKRHTPPATPNRAQSSCEKPKAVSLLVSSTLLLPPSPLPIVL